MRSLKSCLPVVVVFLVSLVPVVVSAEQILNAHESVQGHGDGWIPFKLSLGDSMNTLAAGIAVAGIAIGAGIFFGLKARGAAGKAS